MPLSFIHKMNRTAAEKTLLFSLLAAGLGATIAAMVRAITLLRFYSLRPVAWFNVQADVLSSVEIFVGVIAANLPCLKGPTHRLLVRIGLIGSSAPDISSGRFLYQLPQGKHVRHQLLQLANSGWEYQESWPWNSKGRPRFPEATAIAVQRCGSREDGDLQLGSSK